MMTAEENDLLCRVEGDAPMGQIMRRHWMPACLIEEVAEPDGAPLSGSRTWQCTTAAPARAASIALTAIWRGLRGTCGLRSCVAPDPVTAQVMKTSRVMASGMDGSCLAGGCKHPWLAAT